MSIIMRIQAAVGLGFALAVSANVAYQIYGISVPETIMIGFFACAAIPTFLLTGE